MPSLYDDIGTDHHWTDHERGLSELRRVARRVVLFSWEPPPHDMWVASEYFPCFEELVPEGYSIETTAERLGGARVEPVPIPHDCLDGFFHAYRRRPQAYLDPDARAGISVFALMDGAAWSGDWRGSPPTSSRARGNAAMLTCSSSTSSTAAIGWWSTRPRAGGDKSPQCQSTLC